MDIKVVIVLHSVINGCIKTSLVQHSNNKHEVKYITNGCIPELLKKKFLLFFFTVYKNERKEHKF